MAKVRDPKRRGNTATTAPMGQLGQDAKKASQKRGERLPKGKRPPSDRAGSLPVRALAEVRKKMKRSTLATADREVAEMQVNRALYNGEYFAPEPYQTETGPTLLKTLAYHAYMVASTVDGVPSRNMDLLRRLMAEADALNQRLTGHSRIALQAADPVDLSRLEPKVSFPEAPKQGEQPGAKPAEPLHPKAEESKPLAAEKPLGARERTNLLVIIAALAEQASLDLKESWKTAEAIEAMTDRLGARVSARTISEKLKAIPDALERVGRVDQSNE